MGQASKMELFSENSQRLKSANHSIQSNSLQDA